MIEYLVAGNIDDRIIARAVKALGDGALLAVPTDSSWSIVCSLRSKAGIAKLRRFAGERDERHFTLLCSGIAQFGELCNLDNAQFRLIKRLSPGPYVFILRTLAGTEKALGIRRHEVGIRIPDHRVPLALIDALGSPLYSITAKRHLREGTEPELPEAETDGLPAIPEEELFEGGWELEGIDWLDMVLDDGEDRERIFSTILDLSAGEVRLLRAGSGPWPH
ncbi:MAG: L-threonylcarbamoyladenylate synthase [Treponema sp.]|nr:L-threonylcarbamoyladenylate synthase [Treponema sp.]